MRQLNSNTTLKNMEQLIVVAAASSALRAAQMLETFNDNTSLSTALALTADALEKATETLSAIETALERSRALTCFYQFSAQQAVLKLAGLQDMLTRAKVVVPRGILFYAIDAADAVRDTLKLMSCARTATNKTVVLLGVHPGKKKAAVNTEAYRNYLRYTAFKREAPSLYTAAAKDPTDDEHLSHCAFDLKHPLAARRMSEQFGKVGAGLVIVSPTAIVSSTYKATKSLAHQTLGTHMFKLLSDLVHNGVAAPHAEVIMLECTSGMRTLGLHPDFKIKNYMNLSDLPVVAPALSKCRDPVAFAREYSLNSLLTWDAAARLDLGVSLPPRCVVLSLNPDPPTAEPRWTPANASRRSARGVIPPEFYVHKSILNVENLNGLFTRVKIPAFAFIGEYVGTDIDIKHAKKMPKSNKYMFDVVRGQRIIKVIDAADPKLSSFVRFVNAAWPQSNKHLQNAFFVTKGNKIYLQALHDIHAGQEILADYGKGTESIIMDGGAAFFGMRSRGHE